jgi:hypothetical protein
MLGTSLSASATAGGWFHTLPREVPAYDVNTGGEYFMPPVPYGHYAKDPGAHLAKGIGMVAGPIHGLKGHLAGLGHGLGHGHGHGDGDGCGSGGCGHGIGHGLGGSGCGLGCGLGHGLKSKLGSGCGLGCGLGGHGLGSGLRGGDPCGSKPGKLHAAKHFGPIHPTSQVVATGQTVPSGQAVVTPTSQSGCGAQGCGLRGIHDHFSGMVGKLKCKLCGGRGNGCGGCGGIGMGDPCSSCHGDGCGMCNGCGLLSKLKRCLKCGGAGCNLCMGGHGLKGKLHGLLGGIVGPKYQYFVGPGGPVPLTPGYTPYIVTTRSPRDFFAFPPRTPDGF